MAYDCMRTYQITQYASIYEAIIVHLLWNNFSQHSAVTNIEYHDAYKKACEWPKGLLINFDEEALHLCSIRKIRTPRTSIRFDDKVDAAVSIGFVDQALGEEIKNFYRLRNSVHIESAIRNEIQFEVEQAGLAYRRMQPFTEGIRRFFAAQANTA